MTEHSRNDVPRTSAFVEILCADPDLLRMEFDSIIAATFPEGGGDQGPRPPRRPNDLLTSTLRPARVPAGTTAALLPPPPAHRATAARWARERGPPPPTPGRVDPRCTRHPPSRRGTPNGPAERVLPARRGFVLTGSHPSMVTPTDLSASEPTSLVKLFLSDP